MNLAHIINPVVVPQASSLHFAQPVTIETMRQAREHARGNVDVFLFTAQFPEDVEMSPQDFFQTPDLDRSILDFGVFEIPRKLPLLRDILDRLYDATDADYLIYTNADIGLQPNFYQKIAAFINQGYDAFTINRRTISDRFRTLDEIPEMYADKGEPHRGWDCFVFRRNAYPKYNLGNVCVGIPRADLVLLGNLQIYANCFAEFRNEYLTFHIGNDRSWWRRSLKDYDEHNTSEAIRILTTLERDVGPFSKDSPPATFLYFTRNKLLWTFYQTTLRYVHIPARFGRPLRFFMGLIRSRS